MSKTVFGIPVAGDPYYIKRNSANQLGEFEFSELLRPLIESPRIEAIRWRQYTPYFNDGDVCEFGIYEVTFKVNDRPGSDDDGDYSDGFLTSYNVHIKGGRRERYTPGKQLDRWPYTYEYGTWEPYGDPIDQHADYEAMDALSKAVSSEAFDDLLYETFGDHCEVTVYQDRITVESYDHD